VEGYDSFCFIIVYISDARAVLVMVLNQENGGSQVTNGFNAAARKYWTPDNPTNDDCRSTGAGPNTGPANGVDQVYHGSFVSLDDITSGYIFATEMD